MRVNRSRFLRAEVTYPQFYTYVGWKVWQLALLGKITGPPVAACSRPDCGFLFELKNHKDDKPTSVPKRCPRCDSRTILKCAACEFPLFRDGRGFLKTCCLCGKNVYASSDSRPRTSNGRNRMSWPQASRRHVLESPTQIPGQHNHR